MFETKYIDVIDRIRFDIRNGYFGDKNSRLPSFRRLAQKYDVSLVTISKSMNCLKDENVIEIRGTSGSYVNENINARIKSNDIAIIHELVNDIAGNLAIDMLEKQAKEHNMGTLALKASSGTQYLPKLYTKLNADGFIFLHSTLNQEVAKAMCKTKIPFVSLNQLDSDIIPWVDFDNERGTSDALDFLLEIGCRKIADINFKIEFGDYQKRLFNVYKTKLTAAGCFDDKYFIAKDARSSYREKYGFEYAEKAGKKMAKYLLELPELPDAIIVREISYKTLIEECGRNGVDLKNKAHILLVMEDIQEYPKDFSVLLSPFKKKTKIGFDMLYKMIRNHKFEVTQKLLTPEKHFITK